MRLLLKYKFEILILFVLIAAYFVLRLPNLTLQPIFADEAIYIRWAQVMRAEPTLRFLPLSDGKTPFFMWAMIPLFKVFEDPLLAGRILSVFTGVFTLLGVYLLTRYVFSKNAALWAALLYVVVPYTLFFDRMALVDSMLAGFTVWIVFLTILLVKVMRIDLAMVLGYLLGAAVLTKTPGMMNILILPLSILGFNKWKEKYGLLKLFALFGVAIVIALVIYNFLRLGPNFSQLSARNSDYIFSPTELVGRPLDPFIPHLRDISNWFPILLTWPVLIAIAVGIFFIAKKLNRLGVVVLLWALIPLMIEMVFLRTFTARYLLSSIPLLITIAGFGAASLISTIKFKKSILTAVLLVTFLIPTLYLDYIIVHKPFDAPLPRAEKIGYFEDWTAGYGFPEMAKFLIDKKKEGKVVLGTDGYFGTLPDGIQIYLDKAEIPIVGSTATVSAQLKESAKENLTYFVGNKKNLQGWSNLQLIMEFKKAKSPENGTQDSSALYKVLP